MAGSAICRALKKEGYTNIVTRDKKELDLMDTDSVEAFYKKEKPEYVFIAAAKVGGIMANIQSPVEFLYNNLVIQNNLFTSSYRNGVKKTCFLASSCIYPRECPQPMKEEYLLTGPVEPTNEGYAIAKIAGVKLAEYYHREYGFLTVCPVPCNLYGTNDHFDLKNSHVLSANVRKFIDAVDGDQGTVSMWGTGSARREFMHVDDMAAACLFLMEKRDSPGIINVGSGTDVTIRELAELISKTAGFQGELVWDSSKPDGMPRKIVDSSRMTALGFKPVITLKEGIERTINEYRELKSRGLV
jgi:GDP-L-fucose synthase